MSLELTAENMKLFFPSWLKPLSDKEISDFLETPYKEEPRLWWPEWIKDLPLKMCKTPVIKKNNTKKEIKQEIKEINNKLDWWLEYKQTAPNEITKTYCDIHLEDYLQDKENLQAKLRYTRVKFDNNNLERAKQVPLSNFLKFNNAGFSLCPFHQERSASFHKLPGKNKGYCHGCGKSGDLIDVVMAQNSCTLPEAIKIILK